MHGVEDHLFRVGIEPEDPFCRNHRTWATTPQPVFLSPIPSFSITWGSDVVHPLQEAAPFVVYDDDEPFRERSDIASPSAPREANLETLLSTDIGRVKISE